MKNKYNQEGTNMVQQKIDSSWQMRRVGDEAFSAAVVPGSVYTDLLRNG